MPLGYGARNIYMKKFNFYIRTKKNLKDAIEAFGFVPLFANFIKGFSIEEHVSPDAWWNSDEEWKVWVWKGPVINELKCAYGKFFNKKAVFISKKWFYDFANYRRNGYDFDAAFEDGLISQRERELYYLIQNKQPVTSKILKQFIGYKKNLKAEFEKIISKLQDRCYIVTNDFKYLQDKYGNNYGWGVAEYSTPEKFFGKIFSNNVYKRTPEESYIKIFNHLKQILPEASDKAIKKILG